ncbi:hypothetical protein PESHB4_03590 [Pediococcus ethanolidurans]
MLCIKANLVMLVTLTANTNVEIEIVYAKISKKSFAKLLNESLEYSIVAPKVPIIPIIPIFLNSDPTFKKISKLIVFVTNCIFKSKLLTSARHKKIREIVPITKIFFVIFENIIFRFSPVFMLHIPLTTIKNDVIIGRYQPLLRR